MYCSLFGLGFHLWTNGVCHWNQNHVSIGMRLQCRTSSYILILRVMSRNCEASWSEVLRHVYYGAVHLEAATFVQIHQNQNRKASFSQNSYSSCRNAPFDQVDLTRVILLKLKTDEVFFLSVSVKLALLTLNSYIRELWRMVCSLFRKSRKTLIS